MWWSIWGHLLHTVPWTISPCAGEAPRETEAMFPCLAQAWTRPMSAGGRGGASTGVGEQDNPKYKPSLWGHVQPLRVQIRAESHPGQQ